jgi:signal peptidase II
MKCRKKLIILILFIITLNVACDQGTKSYARKNLKNQGTINVINNIFVLRYVENDGAFLGAGSNIPQPYKTFILILFPVLILIGVFIFLVLNKKLSISQTVCVACIIGGGIGNIFDRFYNDGFVTDFMNFGIGNIRTGILNFADMSITFGAIFLIIFQYLEDKRLKRMNFD